MNKKGFTLIELLAVIILIGVIGLIAVPAINNTLNKQKVKNFRVNVESLVNAVESDAEIDKFRFPRTYLYNDEKLTLVEVKGNATEEDLQVGGKIEEGSGILKYNADGDLFVSIKTDKYCAKKTYTGEVEYGTMTDNNCMINNAIVNLNEE